MHAVCEPLATCGVCCSTFESFTAPEADPRSDGLVPSALRPAKSGGPVFAVGVVLILVFVLILFLFITHGHLF